MSHEVNNFMWLNITHELILITILSHRIVYERVSHHPTLAVFVLSAVWHGFYPGYYMAFATCGLMVEAARKVFICKLKTVEMRTGGLKIFLFQVKIKEMFLAILFVGS